MSVALTSRDRLLRWGAATLVGGSLVGAVAGVLGFIYVEWSVPGSRQEQVASALGLLAWLLLIAAFACASVAFSRTGRARFGGLRVGALLVAGAYLADVGGYAVLATRSRISSADRLVYAGYALPTLVLAAGALIAATAFSPAVGISDRRLRVGRLRWAAATTGLGSALLAITTVLQPRVIKVVVGESYTRFYVTAAGQAIKAAGAVVAARALRLTGGTQPEPVAAAWQARDGGLAVAAALLAGGFLVTTIGGALEATESAAGDNATYLASLWLAAASTLVFALGVGIVSAGFRVSSRTSVA